MADKKLSKEEEQALEDAIRRAKDTLAPVVEQRALPDKMPKREDLR